MAYPAPDASGTIYLVHFSARTRQGHQHYLGWSEDVERRIAQHRSGGGAGETRRAVAEGLKLTVSQTWKGTPGLETRLKEWHRGLRKSFAHMCPLCPGEAALPTALAHELGEPSLRIRWADPDAAVA
jgi:predicted GIY-YIG superfamily endonuclease